MNTAKDQLYQLMQVGRIYESIEILSKITQKKDTDIFNDLILLGGNFQANQRLQNLKLIDAKEANIRSNEVANAVLAYISDASEAGWLDITVSDLNQDNDNRKVKILFVASNPEGTVIFELEKEFLEIRKVFRHKREQFEVIESFGTSYQDLFNIVREERPDILHIAAPSNNDILVLHGPDNTRNDIPYQFLAAPFSMFTPYVSCVFMNTWCSTDFLEEISHSLGTALGSQNLISDTDSILFSSGFYAALAQGADYESAFNAGKTILDQENVRDLQKKETYTCFVHGKELDPK
ncbi:MAG: hypothetical protein AB8F95_20210 [Bacteroidia bacterium]